MDETRLEKLVELGDVEAMKLLDRLHRRLGKGIYDPSNYPLIVDTSGTSYVTTYTIDPSLLGTSSSTFTLTYPSGTSGSGNYSWSAPASPGRQWAWETVQWLREKEKKR